MYSFLFDPAYITLFVMALLIFLVMFLWRKVTILEGNFFILEKRVNLMKKENRESSIAKNLERSNIVMNEIFSDAIAPEVCKTVGTCTFTSNDNKDIVSTVTTIKVSEVQQDVNDVKDVKEDLDDGIKISFTNNDIDKKIEEAIDTADIMNAIDKIEVENDNVSITSEFTLHDDKFNQKKLAKMSAEKIKALCIQLNISSEGTKAQLISRILENNK